jgi:hypothetical protein
LTDKTTTLTKHRNAHVETYIRKPNDHGIFMEFCPDDRAFVGYSLCPFLIKMNFINFRTIPFTNFVPIGCMLQMSVAKRLCNILKLVAYNFVSHESDYNGFLKVYLYSSKLLISIRLLGCLISILAVERLTEF